MRSRKIMKKWIFSLIVSLFCVFHVNTGYAQVLENLTAGTYPVSASLSCYVNAMGGVEFGGPMMKSAEITVGADGAKNMTIYLQKSVVTIYSVTCDTFVDAAPAGAVTDGNIAAGTIGYYNGDGNFTTFGVTYTLSTDTALNSRQEEVPYVDSITFPIEEEKESYGLSLYVNSNVMGTQFSNDGHKAILTVDWGSVSVPKTADKTETQATEKPTETIPETSSEVENTSETASDTPQAEEETASVNVEAMNGLNIYRADEAEEESVPAESPAVQSYTAYFNSTLLAIAGTAGVMLVLIGMILMFIGYREDKKHEK